VTGDNTAAALAATLPPPKDVVTSESASASADALRRLGDGSSPSTGLNLDDAGTLPSDPGQVG
jgi:hypothetical protein